MSWIDEAYNYIVGQLSTNQFFTAAALTGTIMGTVAYLKTIPFRIWNRIQRKVRFTATLTDSVDRATIYRAFDMYISKHYEREARNVEVGTRYTTGIDLTYSVLSDIGEDETTEVPTVTQGNDMFYTWYRRRWIQITKTRAVNNAANSKTNRYSRDYTISGLFAKKQILAMIDAAYMEYMIDKKEQEKDKKKASVYMRNYNSWDRLTGVKLKGFNTIFLEEKQQIIDDLNRFTSTLDVYKRLEVAYKRGYLFYGAPGNGKSTIAGAIAETLNKDLYILDINEVASNIELKELFSRLPNGAVLLLEEIDKIYGRTALAGNQKDLGGLLNALSGIGQKQNIITVMTTNYPEELDSALLRAGRCDMILEIKNPTIGTIREYIKHVFDRDGMEIDSQLSIPFVDLQEVALKHILDYDACVLELNNKCTTSYGEIVF